MKARAKAPVIPVAMNLAYLTGMRLGDLVALRWDQIEAEGIRVRQSKTGAKVLLEWTPFLRMAIDAAKQMRPTVRGLHVLRKRSRQP